ncbi:hypothetical protein PAXRUDRAFT_828878 [Paxillus rubicundulus Ve08.2h10]|uniref:BTB domain-containing protein n=1 Tax=Paxillus rubicundulus Ve08.2h10 TaxID=930991 RepID=A0A0D0E6V6_9AGAM|nr:hypothetical protein PAXRUDRAFT_828878 [Paxillus rubicundulus Ve08.2h10]
MIISGRTYVKRDHGSSPCEKPSLVLSSLVILDSPMDGSPRQYINGRLPSANAKFSPHLDSTQETTSSSSVIMSISPITKHEHYYVPDGNVVFLAERTHFRVHRSFFERESMFFRTFFAHPGDGEPDDGSEDKPYKLDVQSDDFAEFVGVWYKQDYTHSRSKEAWLVVLQLATRWEFPQVRKLAISQLEALRLPPIEKIALYKKHEIDEDLLIPSYIDLCRSPTLPSPADGNLLTMETIINLLNARQRERESPTTSDEVLGSIIAESFGITHRPNRRVSNGPDAAVEARQPTIILQDPVRRVNNANRQAQEDPQTVRDLVSSVRLTDFNIGEEQAVALSIFLAVCLFYSTYLSVPFS